MIEYLVKWKGYDNTENEWLPTEKFDDLKMINEYNGKINENIYQEHTLPIEPQKNKKGRPR